MCLDKKVAAAKSDQNRSADSTAAAKLRFPFQKPLNNKHALPPNLSSVFDQTLSKVTGKTLLPVAQILSHSI